MTGKTSTRRTFLKGMALASSLSVHPSFVRAQETPKVLIIGAGLSGLSAALILEEYGVDVQVIEAKTEPGGRLKSLKSVPGIAELGGKAFGQGYARLIDAAERLNVPYYEVAKSPLRKLELALDNQIVTPEQWSDHPRNVLPAGDRQLMPWSYFNRFMATHMALRHPGDWIDPDFADLDISFDDWMQSRGASREVIDLCCNMHWDYNNSTHEVSALAVMFEMLWGRQVFRQDGRMRSFSFVNGNQSLPFAMEAALRKDIHFNKNVVVIDLEESQAVVQCADGSRYRADRVISSVPVQILRRIAITPQLKGIQREAIEMIPRRMVTHIHVVPQKPFWEQDGRSPAMKIGNAPINFVWPYCNTENPHQIEHLLVSITGQAAANANQMDNESLKKMVTAVLADIRPAAKGVLEVASVKSWYDDPYAGGDWTNFGPGQVSRFAGPMHAPHRRLHLCGDGTSLSARGMEGAMESAERVAVEVLDML